MSNLSDFIGGGGGGGSTVIIQDNVTGEFYGDGAFITTSSTITIPKGVYKVILSGGGGGGAGAYSAANSGGYSGVLSITTGVELDGSYDVVIGAGGAGGVSQPYSNQTIGVGTNGGTSTFNGISSLGGSGGSNGGTDGFKPPHTSFISYSIGSLTPFTTKTFNPASGSCTSGGSSIMGVGGAGDGRVTSDRNFYGGAGSLGSGGGGAAFSHNGRAAYGGAGGSGFLILIKEG